MSCITCLNNARMFYNARVPHIQRASAYIQYPVNTLCVGQLYISADNDCVYLCIVAQSDYFECDLCGYFVQLLSGALPTEQLTFFLLLLGDGDVCKDGQSYFTVTTSVEFVAS